jgi:hypothetical protein
LDTTRRGRLLCSTPLKRCGTSEASSNRDPRDGT